MGLADGEYKTVAQRVVDTLLADTGAGGLREVIGVQKNNDPLYSVNTIEYEFDGDWGKYSETELPAIVVWVRGDNETDFPPGGYRNFLIGFQVYHKAMSLEVTDDFTMRAMARLKQVVRLQRKTIVDGGGFGVVAGDVPFYTVSGGHRLQIGAVAMARGGTRTQNQDHSKVVPPYYSFAAMDLQLGIPVRYTDIC